MPSPLVANALIRRPEVSTTDASQKLLAAAEARGLDLSASTEAEAATKARAVLALLPEHLTKAPQFTPAERLETFEYLATHGHRDAASRLAGQAPGSIDVARQGRSEDRRAVEESRQKQSALAFRLGREYADARERRQVEETRVAELARSTMPPALIREAVEQAQARLEYAKQRESILAHDATQAQIDLGKIPQE